MASKKRTKKRKSFRPIIRRAARTVPKPHAEMEPVEKQMIEAPTVAHAAATSTLKAVKKEPLPHPRDSRSKISTNQNRRERNSSKSATRKPAVPISARQRFQPKINLFSPSASSFSKSHSSYTPIPAPATSSDSEDDEGGGIMPTENSPVTLQEMQSGRTTMPLRDVFVDSNGIDVEDSILTFRFPSELPIKSQEVAPIIKQPAEGIDPENRYKKPEHFPANLSGTIGKLRYHRSGKMSMKIGDVVFNMRRAIPTNFQQEIAKVTMIPSTEIKSEGASASAAAAADADASPTEYSCAKIHFLGTTNTKIICVPDLDDLLQHRPVIKSESSVV